MKERCEGEREPLCFDHKNLKLLDAGKKGTENQKLIHWAVEGVSVCLGNGHSIEVSLAYEESETE